MSPQVVVTGHPGLFVTFYTTEKQKCRSTGTEAGSYHYARDFNKGPFSHCSSSWFTSETFGESYLKTWMWPWVPTMFHSSAAAPLKKSLKQPYNHITKVAEWSRRHKLTLNTRKSEVAFFTNNSKEARWQTSVQLNGAHSTQSLSRSSSELPSTGPFPSDRMSLQ